VNDTLSSFNFDYTVDQTKECINEAESQLRDLLSTVFSGAYGLHWESSNMVWDEATRQKLEECRHQEKMRLPNQKLSDRLIDYSDILHLKGLIQKHWSHFERIFALKEKTMAQFDMLQTLRNPLMHSRPGVLPHQKHLCLGICGEFLLAIENWRQGYTHQIKGYTVFFKFPAYPEGEDENAAQFHAKHLAESWLGEVVGQIDGRLEEKSKRENETAYLLKTHKGHIKTNVTWNYRGNDGHRYFRAADILMTTESYPAIEKLLEANKSPYWYLSWVLKDELDVSIIVSRVRERTGKRPTNAVTVSIPSGPHVYQNASFSIGEIESSTIRAGLFRAHQNSEAQICINFEDPLGKGFYQAHKQFSVEKVLAILYGELVPSTVHQLLREACTM